MSKVIANYHAVESLRCMDCGTVVVAINDIRVSSHKCSGRWQTIRRERVSLQTIEAALQSEPDQHAEENGYARTR